MTTTTDQAQAAAGSFKTERRYKIGYSPNQGDTSTPLLQLSGKWLREAGFDTGIGVTVKIARDCIVIIPDNATEHELREELKKAQMLIKGMSHGMKEARNLAGG